MNIVIVTTREDLVATMAEFIPPPAYIKNGDRVLYTQTALLSSTRLSSLPAPYDKRDKTYFSYTG